MCQPLQNLTFQVISNAVGVTIDRYLQCLLSLRRIRFWPEPWHSLAWSSKMFVYTMLATISSQIPNFMPAPVGELVVSSQQGLAVLQPGSVIKRDHSSHGKSVFFPHDSAEFKEHFEQTAALRPEVPSYDTLPLHFVQPYNSHLRDKGELRLMMSGGHCVYMVWTSAPAPPDATVTAQCVSGLRPLDALQVGEGDEGQSWLRQRYWADWASTKSDAHHMAKKQVQEFAEAVVNRIIDADRSLCPSLVVQPLEIFCRLDVGLARNSDGRWGYTVNELGIGPTQAIFASTAEYEHEALAKSICVQLSRMFVGEEFDDVHMVAFTNAEYVDATDMGRANCENANSMDIDDPNAMELD